MIKPDEIQKKARKAGVRDQQIEKDYVLSWILQGIANHENFSQEIVFKGGTVLKKVYFDDYRFSEDLDFTLLDAATLSNQKLLTCFNDVFAYIKEEANLPLSITESNEHQDGGINFYIGYTGPLGGAEAKRSVKVDISRSERLTFNPVSLPVISGYSDLEQHHLLCYSLEEILVEKLRSVMQRMQARDFYDIWYLLEIHKMDVGLLIDNFRDKCEAKGLNAADFNSKLKQRIPQYKGRWESSIKDQIQNLPEFRKVEREVIRKLRKLG